MSSTRFCLASLTAAVFIVGNGPASSQDDLSGALEDLTSRDAIADAASKLVDEGEDRLLVTRLLDTEIEGSDGETIGTVKDLVVIPGGRVIAAVAEIDDTRIAIPFGAVKVAGSADDVGLEVPVEASEIRDMDELQILADSISGD